MLITTTNQNNVSIDFLIIGAQKSGTTSLHYYLRDNPHIFMPSEKEVAFFSSKKKYLRGEEWYLKTYFSDAVPGQACGEASPQYMFCPQTARNIHRCFPKVKLIALLRNPIDRAYSAYQMALRRGREARSFDTAIEELRIELGKHPDLFYSDECISDQDYVTLGYYGHILQGYLRYFPISQMMIVFSEDLASKPEQTVAEIFRFIGIDGDYVPTNMGHQYHKAGRLKIPVLAKLKIPSIVGRLEFLLPRSWQGAALRLEMWNVTPEAYRPLTATQRLRLTDVFESDVQLLQKIFQVQVPWRDFQ